MAKMKWVVTGPNDPGIAVPLTASEIVQAAADAATMTQVAAAANAAATARAQAVSVVKAKAATDPVYAALVTVLGL